MKKLFEWSQYQETPIDSVNSARLTDTEKLTLLKKLGIDACAEKARTSFIISRRLKG